MRLGEGQVWPVLADRAEQLPDLVKKSSDKVMHALLKMKKLDIAALQRAAGA